MSDTTRTLTLAISTLLRPLVRLLLRQGIAFDALSDQLKILYVDIAEKEFAIEGKKQTVSRISTITGLSRKEVTKAKSMQEFDLGSMTQQYNRAARVIGGWARDKEFHDQKGKPLELMLEGDNISFAGLVKRYSGDIPPRAIADELIRVGAIKRTNHNKVKLIKRAYIPEKNIDEKIKILGTDVCDLIETIYHNIYSESEKAFFQRKVAYNAIPLASAKSLKKEINQRAQVYLEELDKIMIKHDTDINKTLKKTGHCRLGVGIYYFEELSEDE
jgi:Family of unknown function (DUF6502)